MLRQHWPRIANKGERSPTLAKVRHHWRSFANIGESFAGISEALPPLVNASPALAKFLYMVCQWGQTFANGGECSPTLVILWKFPHIPLYFIR
ncbi:hypothetical protein R1flu_007218 [Riccia fluitans]|uniref:Uncharacterized protein n=1 Tax=Riccia fluitans TaxID=41844 RepID=A0ABD1Z0W7_9MARC